MVDKNVPPEETPPSEDVQKRGDFQERSDNLPTLKVSFGELLKKAGVV